MSHVKMNENNLPKIKHGMETKYKINNMACVQLNK